MPRRRPLLVTAVLVAMLLVVLGAVLVPWAPLGWGGPSVRPAPDAFAAADVERGRRLSAELGPWGALTQVARVVILAGVASLLARGRGRTETGWWRRAGRLVAATVGATVLMTLVQLPVAVRNGRILRRYGIRTQPWPDWWRDQAVSAALTAAAVLLVVAALWWLLARAPRTWPYWGAALAAAGVVAASFVWPVLVAPLFEHTHPLPEGPLRTRIVELTQREGLGAPEILVSDASSRTTTYNAYVSGFGPSRRVVLYDTLVARAEQDPDAVMTVVAHETGHAARLDVVRGTGLGAVGAALAVLVAGLLATSAPGERLVRERDASLRATAAAVIGGLTLVQGAQLLAAPVTNVVSRRMEARADVYALDATRDPAAFERMWLEMTRVNHSSVALDPWWRTALYGTHPSAPWRVGQARAWAERERR